MDVEASLAVEAVSRVSCSTSHAKPLPLHTALMRLETSKFEHVIDEGDNSKNEMPDTDIVLTAVTTFEIMKEMFKNVDRDTTVSPTNNRAAFKELPKIAGNDTLEPFSTMLDESSYTPMTEFDVATLAYPMLVKPGI
jgi:hypothetical protein